jgi:hypothetical protein
MNVWLTCDEDVTLLFSVLSIVRLSTWRRILKLIVAQVVRKFPAFYQNLNIITVFARAHHRKLS